MSGVALGFAVVLMIPRVGSAQTIGTPPGAATPGVTQAARPPRDTASLTGTSVLRGRVVAADTRLPLRKAQVRIVSTTPASATGLNLPQSRMTSTDGEGRYEFKELPARGKVVNPLPIPEIKLKLIETIDAFVDLLPQHKKGYPMRFTAADTYFLHGHYDKAIERFAKIIDEIPETKQARNGVKNILGFYGERKVHKKVIDWGHKFLTKDKLLTAKLTKYIQDMIRDSMFDYGLDLEKQNQFQEAAEVFLSFQKEFPKDLTADKALYNASVNYYKVGMVDDALSVSRTIIEEYPNSNLKPDVNAIVAQTYESLAEFKKAADYYALLAKTYPTDNRSENALYNASVLYFGLGLYPEASAALKLYGKNYKNGQKKRRSVVPISRYLRKNS